MISSNVALPRAVAFLIALGSLIDGVFTAVYLSEAKVEVPNQFSWGWVVAGLLMASCVISLARDFEHKTAQHIIRSVGMLILIETLNYVAAYLAIPIARISLYTINIACDVLIMYACVVHMIRRARSRA